MGNFVLIEDHVGFVLAIGTFLKLLSATRWRAAFP
jgi:hypothetical protein